MSNLFSAFFSAFPHPDDNGDFSRGHGQSIYPNRSLTRTQILLEDLLIKNISYEWLTDPIDGDKTIAIFTKSRQISIHFFMREFVVMYCFYDRTIKKCSIEYDHLTIDDTMDNFDRFIQHHYNDPKNNPYFCAKYLP